MDRSRVAILIPAFNEEITISAVVHEVRGAGVPIVIDDGSSDQTARIAEDAGAIVVSHPKNKGYDMAIRTGLQWAVDRDFLVAVTFDADGQHLLSDLIRVLICLEDGAKVVIGIRDRFQRESEKLGSFITRLAWGVRDPLCGMKGYDLAAVSRHWVPPTFNSVGMEMAIRLVLAGERTDQIEISTRDRSDQSRFSASFMANMVILKAIVRLLWRFGKAQR